ncbi:acyl-CoA dehydrogenase [Mycolicibacterium phocaicum]|uniref:Acyl-CoA dehydrogenase n=2 Tax=Mycolicibacterium phocaicum TaxID=319706 RepID=A0A7I7ZIN3_9MYCO|nr:MULTISPECIES: acyl-CoA dehydrogenase [Mycolicibacterium]RUP28910.1 MAG: acyl-CoA dehydrogenase [Mycolicibacterium sp.]TLH65008.1 acyl-CoA dehydrogenase [Mycolicibacterium phocaicum]UCZ58617.1 acyl-CoA dehydrogenase [Mycolicibacterium phocaicum]BBZ53054.1 acyl-CoA dehydrogenase [Mycolicibacterium phocaicum]
MTDFMSRRDLDFLLYEWLDVVELTKHEHFAEHSRDTFDAVLDLSADIATKRFAPHNKKADHNPPFVDESGKVVLIDEIKQALDDFNGAGLMASSFDERVGGMQLPNVVAQSSAAFFRAANPATFSYAFLTVGNANLLTEYGTDEQIDTWVRPMLEGRYFGTMCLSEPDAGSSLADISTKATKAADGTYRVTGTKMWITGGDHELSENIVHLVLAKVPGGGPGVKGISLFIVPKFLTDGTRNDVALVSLNHKMGNHGTTNALLNFGDGSHQPTDEPGAVGYLVGEEHRGLAYMFHMMNEARVAVGSMATAIGYAGYLTSLEYAKVRTQGRPVGDKDPSRAQVAIIEHADVKRMLLAQKSYVEGALALGLYCARLVDQIKILTGAERDEAELMLEVLTPIAKSWPSQWCLEANNLGIQIHGGYGYTTEYDVEQQYRDNRLNAIHEGTHGIHGIDLLGRKVVMQGGAGLTLLQKRINDTVQTALQSEATAGYARELQAQTERLAEVTATLWAAGDPETTLANSTAYLEAAGHIVMAWIWLEQLNAAGGNTGNFYDGKRAAAQYFFRYELPKVTTQLDLLASLDRTTVEAQVDWF